jgi:hypothetical protein
MNVSTSIPVTVQIRRSRLLGLLGVVAVLAAAVTWAVLALAGDTGSDQALSSATSYVPSLPIPAVTVTRASEAQQARTVRSIMDLTPGDLAGGGLGGYALPSRRTPTSEDVLASMSPQTRRYTKAVMGLTFRQLAAGAAGSP